MRTVAVVGAPLAGASAARSLRKRGYDGRLVLIGDEAHRPYDRPRTPYFWSDRYGIGIPFAGHAAGAESVTVEDGGAEGRDVLAVYRRAGHPVAVPGMNRVRLFTCRRGRLAAA
ncbi:oxidoreductase C-terminal domain-containing protein [Streptomyces sp. NPDC056628]|uniref:oxidoreductase C-terminal domain-containing protein n=1 Tax=Streptomyces sp. NPDC056628 TaxID=3345882 RepID=UPI0036A2A084